MWNVYYALTPSPPPFFLVNKFTKLFLLLSFRSAMPACARGSSTGIGGGLGMPSAGPVMLLRFFLLDCGRGVFDMLGRRDDEVTIGSFEVPLSGTGGGEGIG